MSYNNPLPLGWVKPPTYRSNCPMSEGFAACSFAQSQLLVLNLGCSCLTVTSDSFDRAIGRQNQRCSFNGSTKQSRGRDVKSALPRPLGTILNNLTGERNLGVSYFGRSAMNQMLGDAIHPRSASCAIQPVHQSGTNRGSEQHSSRHRHSHPL